MFRYLWIKLRKKKKIPFFSECLSQPMRLVLVAWSVLTLVAKEGGIELFNTWVSLLIKCSKDDWLLGWFVFVWPLFGGKHGKVICGDWLLRPASKDEGAFVEPELRIVEAEGDGKVDSIICPTELVNMVVEFEVFGKLGFSNRLLLKIWLVISFAFSSVIVLFESR